MSGISYRRATCGDVRRVTELAVLLYDEHSNEEILEEISELLPKEDTEAMILAFDDQKAVGFSHCSLRYDYVEGTDGGTIGYLEGVYVLPEYRMLGIAKTLVGICEEWARGKGCAEFASDCQLDNEVSYRFHLHVGFSEVNRMICFAKKL